MRALSCAILAVLVTSACARAERAASTDAADASVATFARDSVGSVTASILNRRWLAERLDNDGENWILLAETDTARWCGGEIEWCHTVSLKAWLGPPDTLREPAWERVVVGDPGGLEPRFRPELYRIEHLGCCDSQDAASYVSVRTGALAFRATRRLLRLTGDGDLVVRRLGFLDTWSALKPVEERADSRFGGLLQYGNPGGRVQRVGLIADTTVARFKFCCRLDSIELRATPSAKGSDELFVAGARDDASWQSRARFAVWLRLMPDYESGFIELLIPVRGDSIDVEGVSLPQGLSLVRLPDAT
jgi:hypothetical protein